LVGRVVGGQHEGFQGGETDNFRHDRHRAARLTAASELALFVATTIEKGECYCDTAFSVDGHHLQALPDGVDVRQGGVNLPTGRQPHLKTGRLLVELRQPGPGPPDPLLQLCQGGVAGLGHTAKAREIIP
jgi:hypothetical protein